jgi:ABC-2 type transport system permease protein
VTTAIWLDTKGSGMSAGVWRTVAGGIGWNVAFAVLGVGLGAPITNLMAAVALALTAYAVAFALAGTAATVRRDIT